MHLSYASLIRWDKCTCYMYHLLDVRNHSFVSNTVLVLTIFEVTCIPIVLPLPVITFGCLLLLCGIAGYG